MNKNLMITLGDSFVEGVGCYIPELVEKYKNKEVSMEQMYRDSLHRFNKYAWPTYVTKSIGYDLINLGQGGFSNSAIAKSFVKKEFSNLGEKYDNVIVILILSDPGRISFYRDGIIRSVAPGSSEEKDIKLYEAYLDFINLENSGINKNLPGVYSPTDCILETAFYINCIDNFCKLNGYYLFYGASFTNIHEITQYYNTKYNIHNYIKNKYFSIHDMLHDDDMKSVCGHPNEKGHVYIGNLITDALVNNFSNII
jgi:hypothetical protein